MRKEAEIISYWKRLAAIAKMPKWGQREHEQMLAKELALAGLIPADKLDEAKALLKECRAGNASSFSQAIGLRAEKQESADEALKAAMAELDKELAAKAQA